MIQQMRKGRKQGQLIFGEVRSFEMKISIPSPPILQTITILPIGGWIRDNQEAEFNPCSISVGIPPTLGSKSISMSTSIPRWTHVSTIYIHPNPSRSSMNKIRPGVRERSSTAHVGPRCAQASCKNISISCIARKNYVFKILNNPNS